MALTQVRGKQILDGGIDRDDINTTSAGKALITKLIAGTTLVSINGSINRLSSPRSGTVVFTCGTATATVYVEQDGTMIQ